MAAFRLFAMHWRRGVVSRGFAATATGAELRNSMPLSTGIFVGAVAGGVAATCVVTYHIQRQDSTQDALDRLPRRIILVRHGESEGNADHTLYRTKADNLIELTDKGSQQALQAGNRIKQVIGDDKVTLFISPFARTLQTSRNIRLAFEDQIIHTHISPQIREQEFGNLQGDDFKQFRKEQQQVGRFYYRFPTGESGSDVYDRTKAWWDTLMRINERPKADRADSIVVVTHGLTMRLILMQLYGWSPDTFNSVWNAGNCHIYVLKKDLSRAGFSPYVHCPQEGDYPESSTMVVAEFMNGTKKPFLVKDYLSVPQPRTEQREFVKKMLEEQHGIDAKTVKHIDFFGGKFSKFR